MSHDFEQYIPVMKEAGVNTFMPEHKAEIRRVFGSGAVSFTIDPAKRKSSELYLRSALRLRTNQLIGSFVWYMAGAGIASKILEGMVEKIDPPVKGFYILRVGFTKDGMVGERKIRTLIDKADKKDNGPFKGSSYSNSHYIDDKMINHWLTRFVRKVGADEMTQFPLIRDGLMSTVGPRGYTENEQRDLDIMTEAVESHKLENSHEVKWIVKNHKGIVQKRENRPGILNPRAALRASSHISRMALDIWYFTNANPGLDWKIALSAITNRERTALFNGADGK